MSMGTNIQVQERDVALLRGLFESRVMSQAQVTRLYFEGREEAAKKRLQSLKSGGLVGERPRRRYEPSVLFLRKEGFSVLLKKADLAGYPKLDWPVLEKRLQVSEFNLRHELAVVDVKTAMMCEVAKTATHEVIEFSTWPRLFAFEASRPDRRRGLLPVSVRADGFIRIGERAGDGEFSFFLEVDRSTETQDQLAEKALCYRDYFQSGGFAVKCGAAREDYKDFPFRVLMVFQNSARRNNTAERLLQLTPPISQQVWLSTITEVTTNPLARIWIRPADYRAVTAGTRFDPGTGFISRGSEPDRDRIVAESMQKRCLLDS